MTIRQVQEHGFQTRSETGDPARIAFVNQDSARRFMELKWVQEARRLNMRAAHRRWLRRNGHSFDSDKRAAIRRAA